MKTVTKSIKDRVLGYVGKNNPSEDEVKEAINSIFTDGIKEYNKNRNKELASVIAKTTLAVTGIVLNPDLFSKQSVALLSYVASKPQRPSSPKHIQVRNLFKQLANLADVVDAKTLSDIDDESTRNLVEQCLHLCSETTGLSIENIVKLQFDYTGKEKPWYTNDCADTNTIDITSQVLEGEDRIPSLNSRIMLAYSLWANGDTPNKFGFHVGSVKSIKDYLSTIKNNLILAKKSVVVEDIKEEPLIDKNGNIRYK